MSLLVGVAGCGRGCSITGKEEATTTVGIDSGNRTGRNSGRNLSTLFHVTLHNWLLTS